MRASSYISWFAYPRDIFGGSIVPPIDPKIEVEVMFENGLKAIAPAGALHWYSDLKNPMSKIVAYRIIWER